HILYQHEQGTDDGEIIYVRVLFAVSPPPPQPPPPEPPSAVQTTPAAAPLQPSAPKPGCSYMAATQHNLCAGFRTYWQRFGGLAIYGNPISEEFVENGFTVQYFERARFEWHPGAAPARGDVLLGLLGNELTADRRAAGDPPFQAVAALAEPGCAYVAATQHNLCAGFRTYWQRFGGLAIYGNPISEEFVENGFTVQYFERARFEWHPGAAPARGDVLLRPLGADLLA